MRRGTLGVRIGCVVVASAVLAGCASGGQNRGGQGGQSGNGQGARSGSGQGPRSRSTTPSSTSQQPQSPLPPVNLVRAAADLTNSAVGAAAGAVNGAINGAVAGANGGAQTTRQRGPRIKPNGRGGYDASELQQDAIRRAHAAADRYGTIDRSGTTTAVGR